ncbi:MAG: HD domain-containing protein [Firmicutes bacterium]|nr:HD domain-containing protein [Bacillota bacterium]
MALFKKKTKETEEQAAEQNAQESAQQSKENKERAAAVFSQRAAGIFGMMYRLILSVNLASDVCQIESGSGQLFSEELPLRMHYSEFCARLINYMSPDDKEAFIASFAPEKLLEGLRSDACGAEGTFAVGEADKLADEDSNLTFWNIKADLIPDPAHTNARCILYIKEVEGRQAFKTAEVIDSEELQDFNSARISSLMGGAVPLFYEYNVEKDIMYVHSGDPEAPTTELANYLQKIDSRSDWTIFHSDLAIFKKLLTNAIQGESGNIEMRYRANAGSGKGFHVHKVSAAPAGQGKPAKWVVGTFVDADSQIKAERANNEINVQLTRLVGNMFERIYEFDIDRDVIYAIDKKDDSFEKETQAVPFSAFVNHLIAEGTVDPGDIEGYKNLLKKGFLERKTLTGNYEMDLHYKRAGASDYSWFSLLISHVSGSRYMIFARDQSEIQSMRKKSADYEESMKFASYNQQLLETVANLVEFRNLETGAHITHVKAITRILMEAAAELCPEYEISKEDINLYSEAAILHDIGKIIVPDGILNKPGKLTDDEMEILRRHTIDGEKIIDRLTMPGQEELHACFKDVARHHHERWDGKGYPDGTVGDAIPFGTQAVGIADVYDALVSPRSYKAGIPSDKAIEMIFAGEAGQFNPKLLECFKVCVPQIKQLY